MTRDEILNMPAGRELDRLVMEWVTEFTVDDNFHIPAYSTDIAAAWDVKGKIGFPISLVESMLGGDFSCELLIDADAGKTVEAIADTAPLAVCRAALLAVMDTE